MVEFVLLLFCQEVTLLALLEVWFVIIVPTPDGSWKTFEMPSARRVSSRQPVTLLKEKRGRGPLPGPFSLASLNGSLWSCGPGPVAQRITPVSSCWPAERKGFVWVVNPEGFVGGAESSPTRFPCCFKAILSVFISKRKWCLLVFIFPLKCTIFPQVLDHFQSFQEMKSQRLVLSQQSLWQIGSENMTGRNVNDKMIIGGGEKPKYCLVWKTYKKKQQQQIFCLVLLIYPHLGVLGIEGWI